MQHINNPFKTAEIKSLETKIDYQNVIVNNLIRQVNELENNSWKPGKTLQIKLDAIGKHLEELYERIEELDEQDTERLDAIDELDERLSNLEVEVEEDKEDCECSCCNEPEETKATWINVRRSVPEEGQFVLCYCSHPFNVPHVNYCKFTKGSFVYSGIVYNPDFWCPLPKP